MDTCGDGEAETADTGVGGSIGGTGEERTEGGEDTEPTEHEEKDAGGSQRSNETSPTTEAALGMDEGGVVESEGEKEEKEEDAKDMELEEGDDEEEKKGDNEAENEETNERKNEGGNADFGEEERTDKMDRDEAKEQLVDHQEEGSEGSTKDEGTDVNGESAMGEDGNQKETHTKVSCPRPEDSTQEPPTLEEEKEEEEKEESGNGELTWSVITPAQSPMQPVLEAFPSPQVPVLSTVQSPQTPLLGHTVEDAPHPSEITYPREEPQDGTARRLIVPPGAEPSSLKPFTDSSESLELQPLLDSIEAQEQQPLLDNTDSSVDTLSNSAQSHHLAAAASSLPHHRQSPFQQQQQQQKQQKQPHQRSGDLPPSLNLNLTPLPFTSIADQPLAASSLVSIQPPLVSPRSGGGHSSGLVPLQLTPHRHQGIQISSSPGQPVLTTLQSPQQPHRVRQAPQQPVLAPLHLPSHPRRHCPLDLSSALTPPLPPPGTADPFLVVPQPSTQAREDVPEDGALGVTRGAEGGRDPATSGGGPPEAGPSSSGLQEEEGATSNHTKPNRNLHLDLGWVWGQDATRCRAARTPERSRIRKARAVPVSPAVAPLAAASDMDTADSGLGTADGDLSFAAPYPPCLPTSADLAATTQTTFMLSDKWKSIFDKYDPEGQGEVSVDAFRSLLADSRFRSQVAPHKLEVLETLAGNGRSSVTYQDLVNIMSNKRRRSFKIAVHCRDQDIVSENDFRLETGTRPGVFPRMVRRIAKEFLTDERDRQYYADHYTCCPPPVFVPAVTLIEVGFFIYYSVEAGDISPSGPVPANSMFIYRPDKRVEIWRFFFYMLIHAGWVHLFFNMLVQLLVGVPLEMVHGSLRIGTVYMAGVLAGSLGTSVFDMDAYLVGASGGVYALLAAHLANILLNYSEMELGIFKLVAVFIIASADVGFAIWDRYSTDTSSPPVGYVSHLMGALAGLTIGLLVLKNFQQKLHVQILWWVALGVYCVCTMFAIFWNILYY